MIQVHTCRGILSYTGALPCQFDATEERRVTVEGEEIPSCLPRATKFYSVPSSHSPLHSWDHLMKSSSWREQKVLVLTWHQGSREVGEVFTSKTHVHTHTHTLVTGCLVSLQAFPALTQLHDLVYCKERGSQPEAKTASPWCSLQISKKLQTNDTNQFATDVPQPYMPII